MSLYTRYLSPPHAPLKASGLWAGLKPTARTGLPSLVGWSPTTRLFTFKGQKVESCRILKTEDEKIVTVSQLKLGEEGEGSTHIKIIN